MSLQVRRQRVFLCKDHDHPVSIAEVPAAQQQTGILFTIPLQRTDLQTAVFLKPFDIDIDCYFNFVQAHSKIVRFADEDPIQVADEFLYLFRCHIADNDRDDALCILMRMVQLHLANFRRN